ncbi:MAG: trigger factor [Clostridia bacterium]|nr:trigger factor [Clostridia bacterium]
MEHTFERLPDCKVRIHYTLTNEEFEEYKRKGFLRDRKRFNVPGFRKGKAPMALVRNYYGDGVLIFGGMEEIVLDTVEEIFKEEKAYPYYEVGYDLKPENADEGSYSFYGEFTEQVRAEICDAEGLEVNVPPVATVSDADVEAKIAQELKKQASREQITDRPCQDGDIVNIDYEGTIDGVPFEGGKADHHQLTLGQGTFLAELEEQIKGMTIGETRDCPVTFPEDYHGKDVAGKAAVFKVVLNSILHEEIPELDDDFVQDISEFDTVEEYRASVRKDLEELAAERTQATRRNAIIYTMMDKSTIEFAEAFVDEECKKEVDNSFKQYEDIGLSREYLLGAYGMTEEAYTARIRADLVERLKGEHILLSVIADDELKVEDGEVDAYIEKQAQGANVTVEEFKKSLSEDELKNIASWVITEKAYKILEDKVKFVVKEPAKTTEVPAEEENKAE